MHAIEMITRISPGTVGSVGDVLTQVQLKTSMPDLPHRNLLSDSEASLHGTNVQDGDQGYYVYNGSARVEKSDLVNFTRKTIHGWEHQDLRAPDKRYEATQSFSFSSFDNQKARLYQSRISGQNFLPLPGGYQLGPNDVPRAGLTPRITDLAAGDFTPGQGSVVTNPILKGADPGLRQTERSREVGFKSQKRIQ